MYWKKYSNKTYWTPFSSWWFEAVLLCSNATNRVLNNQQIYCCNRLLPVISQKKLTDCCNPLLCLSQTTKRQLKAIKFRLVPVIIFSNLHNSVRWQSREFNEVLNKQLLLIFRFLRSNHLLGPVTADTEHKNAASVGVHATCLELLSPLLTQPN